MNSKEFLKEKLTIIFNRIEDIKISYEFNSFINTHIILIQPSEIYEDDKYINEEFALENEFESLFPSESILFIDNNSLNSIENPEFVLERFIKDPFTEFLNFFDSMFLPENEEYKKLDDIQSEPVCIKELNFIESNIYLDSGYKHEDIQKLSSNFSLAA